MLNFEENTNFYDPYIETYNCIIKGIKECILKIGVCRIIIGIIIFICIILLIIFFICMFVDDSLQRQNKEKVCHVSAMHQYMIDNF